MEIENATLQDLLFCSKYRENGIQYEAKVEIENATLQDLLFCSKYRGNGIQYEAKVEIENATLQDPLLRAVESRRRGSPKVIRVKAKRIPHLYKLYFVK